MFISENWFQPGMVLKTFINTAHPNIFPHDVLDSLTSLYMVLFHTENGPNRTSYSHHAILNEQLLFFPGMKPKG